MFKKTSHFFPIVLMFFVTANADAKEGAKKQDNLSKEAIESQFESSKKVCEQKKEQLKEVCLVEAEGNRDVANAKLKAEADPTLENRVDYRVAVAEAKYSLSIKKCQTSKTRPECMHKAQVLRDKETEDARAVRHE